MPEIYDFTARATAASGAFADRDFSITVKNTQLDRLLAVGPDGAARMLDAKAGSWTPIAGVKGDSAAYGDRWLIWDQAGGALWRSADAINWEPIAPKLPAGYARLGFLRWRAGAWRAAASNPNSQENAIVTSTDGGETWTLSGATVQDGEPFFSFERSEAGASILATRDNWYFRPDDRADWTPARSSKQSYRFQIAHLNGIWFGPNDTNDNGTLAHSSDGTAWFAQSNPSVLTSRGYYRGVAWGNGYAIACAYTELLTGYTTDAGLTVQAGAALPGQCLALDSECPIVNQGGRFVILGDGQNSYHANSPQGPWALCPYPAGVSPVTLAVRP